MAGTRQATRRRSAAFSRRPHAAKEVHNKFRRQRSGHRETAGNSRRRRLRRRRRTSSRRPAASFPARPQNATDAAELRPPLTLALAAMPPPSVPYAADFLIFSLPPAKRPIDAPNLVQRREPKADPTCTGPGLGPRRPQAPRDRRCWLDVPSPEDLSVGPVLMRLARLRAQREEIADFRVPATGRLPRNRGRHRRVIKMD